ncbi:MAG: exosortase A [Erythrobacter sp.]
MQPDALQKQMRETSLITRLPEEWRMPLARLALAWAAIFVLTAQQWAQMFHQWWDIDTYNHILLIPPVIAWLVYLRSDGLRSLKPSHWTPGVAVLTAALALWLIGRMLDINILAQTGAVGALQACVLTFLGPRLLGYLLLPVGMMAVLVPFGDEVIPYLQSITAEIAIGLTKLSGVEAVYEDIYIHTPAGLFIVAEECSGVKFLIAMLTLGVFVAFTSFQTWKRRIIFMASCFIVPIIANGIRAWGTIYIAQSQGAEFAAGFDHIIYGWVFFAIVMAIVLGGAFRFFDREPEDAGYSVEQLDRMAWISKLEKHSGTANIALLTALALILGFGLAAIYAAAPVV